MKNKFLLVAVLCCFWLVVSTINGQEKKEILTNEKIIELVKSGWGESLIVGKIRQSECQCDTSIDGVNKLKAAKISDPIIMAMLEAASSGKTYSESGNKNQTADESLLKNLPQPYILNVSKPTRNLLPSNSPNIVQTKAKGDSIPTIIIDDTLRNIGEGMIVDLAVRGILASGAMGAIPILGGVATIITKLPGLRREPTFTYLYALPGQKSKNTEINNTPKFELFYGDVVGANPDEFEPKIIKINSTPNNWRLVGAQKSKAAWFQSGEKMEFNFIEEIIPSNTTKMGRGQSIIEPQQPLVDGEYAIVLRPISKTYKISYKDITYKNGEGVLVYSVWDFSVQTTAASNSNQTTISPNNEVNPINNEVNKSSENKQTPVNNKTTASDIPEITINADIEKVRGVILRKFIKYKFGLDKDQPNQLVFSKEAEGTSGFLAGVFLGNDQKNPRQIVTFILTKSGNEILVLANYSTMYPNSSGQGTAHTVDNKKTRQQLNKELAEIKKEAEN